MANKNTKKNNENLGQYFKDFEKKHKVVSKKGLAIGIAGACALVTLGGLTAGHFAYKYTHNEVSTDQPKVNPSFSDEVEISKFELDSEGNKVGTITSKTDKEFSDIKVSIGGTALKETDEYVWQSNAKKSSKKKEESHAKADIKILRKALDAHKGVIEITPVFGIQEFSVMFHANCDGEVEDPSTQSVKKGERAIEPLITRLNYKLTNWSYNKEGTLPFDFNTTITESIELYAQWEETVDPQEYKVVTFNTYDGTPVDPINVQYGKTIPHAPQSTYEGHTLTGWNLSGRPFKFGTDKVTQNITLDAVWVINKYTVTFDSNGGDTGITTRPDVEHNTTITAPTIPTKAGYTLKGWYLNGKKFNFNGEDNPTPVTSDITLIADWNEDTVTVSFLDSNDKKLADPQTVLRGNKLVEPTISSKKGYTFDGWYTGKDGTGNKWDFSKGVEPESTLRTKTLYANFEVNSCFVTIDGNGGYLDDNPGTLSEVNVVDYDETIADAPKATREGYKLDDDMPWVTVDETGPVEFKFGDATTGTHVIGDMTVKANWVATAVTVSFIAGDDTKPETIPTQTVKIGDKLVEPQVTKEGYTLEGWYTDEQHSPTKKWDFTKTTVDENTTKLYASWVPIQYKVTFDAADGTTPKESQAYYGDKIDEPEDPERSGYDFKGWYCGAKKWDFDNDTVKCDTVLTAHWDKTEEMFSVTFNTSGGSGSVKTQIVPKGGKATLPSYIGTKYGYTLEEGVWYEDETFQYQFDFNIEIEEDLVLFAHFEENTPNERMFIELTGGGTSLSLTSENISTVKATLTDEGEFIGKIKYESNNPDAIMVDADTGVVKLGASAKVNDIADITAIYCMSDGTTIGETKTTSITFTVIN